jgi:hypothetical protein
MHPILEKPLVLEAPLPPRITRILELLEKHRMLGATGGLPASA